MLRKVVMPSVGLAAVLGAAGCGSAASSPTASASSAYPATYAQACQEAKTEGKITIWTGTPESEFRSWFATFEKDTGVHLTLSYLSITDSSVPRLITLHDAGQPNTVDIVDISPDEEQALIQHGMADLKLDWTKYGVPSSRVTAQDDVLYEANPIGVVYNPNKISAAQVPDDWQQFLEPQFAGKFAQDPRGRPFDAMALVWGAQQAINFTKQLKTEAKPKIIQGLTPAIQAVINGEVEMATQGSTVDYLAAKVPAYGGSAAAPIAIKYLDYTYLDGSYYLRLANAPDPAAAICYIGWFESAAGQALELKDDGINATPHGVPPTSHLVTENTAAQALEVDQVATQEAAIWAGVS
jgi:iron(III) transport system substrate-binding protein